MKEGDIIKEFIIFFSGLFLGAALGIFIMCLCQISKNCDTDMYKNINNN